VGTGEGGAVLAGSGFDRLRVPEGAVRSAQPVEAATMRSEGRSLSVMGPAA
jgi:hypothetical protein